MTQQPTYKTIFRQPDGKARTMLFIRICDYFEDHDCALHYVNLYTNEDELVVVMSDRDAAIKLKLALA